jgi:hypothetical protein
MAAASLALARALQGAPASGEGSTARRRQESEVDAAASIQGYQEGNMEIFMVVG